MASLSSSVAETTGSAQLSLLRLLSPAIPYVAVGFGLFLLHNAILSIALYHVGMVSVLLLERRGDPISSLLRGFDPWLLLASIVLSLLGGGITFFCWPLLGLPHLHERLLHVGLSAGVLPWFFLYFALVNPVLEEAFWRGYHENSSSRPVWNDLWFAGYHISVVAFFMQWYWLPLVLCGLLFMAWVWRLLAAKLQGLLINCISHVAADLGIVVAVLLLLR